MASSFGRRFGTRLRAFRQARGLTQEGLAAAAKKSPNYIGILERGQKLPAIDTLADLAKAVGVSPAELLGDVKAADAWLDEMTAIAKAMPGSHRALALALLRTVLQESGSRRR
jgi:transcriptional regulator with XRE-family HTH domain